MALVAKGVKPIVPQPTTPDKPESEATDYWQSPLALATQYHQRAELFAQSCPVGSASNDLRKIDGAEKDEWVHRHRMAEDIPLGKLIRHIVDENAKLRKTSDAGN